MAGVNTTGIPFEDQLGDWWGTTSAQTVLPSTLPAGDPQYNARQAEFEGTTNWGHIASQLQNAAKERGVAFDISDVQDIRRNAGYDAAHLGDAGVYNNQLQKGYEAALRKYDERGPLDPTGDAEYYKPGGVGAAQGQPMPGWANRWSGYEGGTFSDPWTSQLESLLKGQLDATTAPGAGSPQQLLTSFLLKRFQDLSTSNGYSPEEQAILNTQALEPIEAQRQASQQRALERASLRGILPSSGVVSGGSTGELSANDRFYDQMRTVANRDLAVNQIQKRQSDLNQALAMVQGLSGNESSQQAKALQLSTLLRQLPIDAQNQALNVINGTGSPSNLLALVNQMVTQGTILNQQQQAAFWNAIGQAAGGLNF